MILLQLLNIFFYSHISIDFIALLFYVTQYFKEELINSFGLLQMEWKSNAWPQFFSSLFPQEASQCYDHALDRRHNGAAGSPCCEGKPSAGAMGIPFNSH